MKWSTIVTILLAWMGACAAAGWLAMAFSGLTAQS